MAKRKSPMDQGEAPELKPKSSPKPGPDGQLDLIDVEHPANKKIIALAKVIRSFDRDRSEAQGKADEKRHEMAELLRENKIARFKNGDVEVTLKEVEKVSVKIPGTNSDN